MSTMVIVESIPGHLVSELAVQSVLEEGGNRVDRYDNPKAMMIKDSLLLLGGLVTEFPRRYVI